MEFSTHYLLMADHAMPQKSCQVIAIKPARSDHLGQPKVIGTFCRITERRHAKM